VLGWVVEKEKRRGPCTERQGREGGRKGEDGSAAAGFLSKMTLKCFGGFKVSRGVRWSWECFEEDNHLLVAQVIRRPRYPDFYGLKRTEIAENFELRIPI
jgi:hypothetical protein